ncbi:MAG: ABC transporter ATP-binding protein [Clostridia bacterium]|nr:ABC transporter ATP-binding protein [Clostridia bacterium]
MLKGEHVTVRYGDHTVVNDLSFHLREGMWLMLAGPNGAGKSSLIHAVSQGVPYGGVITLEGKDVRRYKPTQLAQKIGVLSQKNNVGYAFSVEEVVSLGRYAHARGFLAGKDEQGDAQVEYALELTGLTGLRKANALKLSGGEMQRMFLAQVFAQDPSILILDEPANHLDLVYQKHIFSLISEWLKTPGRAVLSVVHDLNLAKKYGTHAVLMNNGSCVAQGELAQVLTPQNLQTVYNMDVYGWMREMLAQWQ